MEEIESKDHLDEIIKNNRLVFVDVYGTYCGPCKAVAPYLNRLAERNDHVKFVKVNVELDLFDVEAVPTFFLIEKGKVKTTFAGVNKPLIEQCVKEALIP
jgi:thioredoxin 1